MRQSIKSIRTTPPLRVSTNSKVLMAMIAISFSVFLQDVKAIFYSKVRMLRIRKKKVVKWHSLFLNSFTCIITHIRMKKHYSTKMTYRVIFISGRKTSVKNVKLIKYTI